MNANPQPIVGKEEGDRDLLYDVDIEQALIGAVMVDNAMLTRAVSLKPEHFYDPLHQRLYAAIVRMASVDEAITPLTLHSAFIVDAGMKKVGGIAYLKSLARAAPALPNIKDYARIIADMAMRRELIRIGEEIVSAAAGSTVETPLQGLIADAESALRCLSGSADGSLQSFSAAELAGRTIPERQELVEGLLPSKVVAMLAGEGATGKSTIALQLGAAYVLKRPWLGRYVYGHGSVLFVSAEEDDDELHRRLASVLEDMGATFKDAAGLHLRSLVGEDSLLAIAVAADRIEPTSLFHRLEATIRTLRPGLVILDTLSDFFGGDEIKRSQARQFVTMLRGLAVRHDTTVLLLSHPSLSGIQSRTGQSGSTGWSNSVRARLYFERIKGSDGNEDDPDARILTSKKANYSQQGDQIRVRWQRGVFKVQQEGGMDVTAAADVKADRVFLEMLASYHGQGRNVGVATGHSYAPTIFAKDKTSAGVSKRDLEAAMNRLLRSGQIRVETIGPPSRQTKRLTIVRGDGK